MIRWPICALLDNPKKPVFYHVLCEQHGVNKRKKLELTIFNTVKYLFLAFSYLYIVVPEGFNYRLSDQIRFKSIGISTCMKKGNLKLCKG